MSIFRIAGLCALLTVFAVAASGAAPSRTLPVARFSSGTLDGWERTTFVPGTEYRLLKDRTPVVLRADSRGGAVSLYREISVDLRATPYLTWRWKIDGVFNGLDERTRGGDDYPARIYIVASGGLAFWKTQAINYVWSSSQAVETTWPSAFTPRSIMVAVQSGAENAGRWVVQKRNVRADFKRLFGRDVDEIHMVAIMTDTDQSGNTAGAYYGDISFSAE